MIEIRSKGNLAKRLNELANLKDVQNAVKVNTTEMHRKATRNASFKGHYDSSGNFIKPTGATKRSIEAEKRAANIEHKRKINNSAVKDLVAAGVSEECARLCIKAIAQGLVTNVNISY